MKALISKEKGEDTMKKLVLLLVTLFGAFALVGCVSGEILADADHDYYITGQFEGWSGNNEDYKMEAIARNDERIKSIVKETKGAEAIYITEVTFSAEAVGWTAGPYKVGDVIKTYDGNLTFKVTQTNAGDEVPNWWGQAPESGKIDNLTPETAFVPNFTEEEAFEGSGKWNDNPVVLEAGTYYVVYIKFADTKAVAVIAK